MCSSIRKISERHRRYCWRFEEKEARISNAVSKIYYRVAKNADVYNKS